MNNLRFFASYYLECNRETAVNQLIDKQLSNLDGIISAKWNAETQLLKVEYMHNAINPEVIKENVAIINNQLHMRQNSSS